MTACRLALIRAMASASCSSVSEALESLDTLRSRPEDPVALTAGILCTQLRCSSRHELSSSMECAYGQLNPISHVSSATWTASPRFRSTPFFNRTAQGWILKGRLNMPFFFLTSSIRWCSLSSQYSCPHSGHAMSEEKRKLCLLPSNPSHTQVLPHADWDCKKSGSSFAPSCFGTMLIEALNSSYE